MNLFTYDSLSTVRTDRDDADSCFKEFLDKGKVYFFGNGACKCIEAINHPNAVLIKGIEPLAKNMFPLAEKAMMRGEFQDAAYFEPFYLKEFVALKSKKLL